MVFLHTGANKTKTCFFLFRGLNLKKKTIDSVNVRSNDPIADHWGQTFFKPIPLPCNSDGSFFLDRNKDKLPESPFSYIYIYILQLIVIT